MTVNDRPESTSGTHPSSPAEVRRVMISSYLGNTIEYYDFILYGSAAALFFGPLFFSNLSPALATIVSFATLATGFVARPFGGVLFGYLGDRIGRKPVLLITMIMMSFGSGLIGLLPTYAQMGVLAPLLLVLLRVIQGFAVGGEWGGAALLAAEHAPPERRGFITSIGQAGLPSGGLLSTLAMTGVSLLPRDQLFSWGWRLPFLLSFLLLAIGMYVRVRVSESPLFDELTAVERDHRRPLAQLMRQPRALLRGIAATLPPLVASTLFGSFAVSYAVGIGHSRSTVLVALGVAWAGAIVATPMYGKLSDRFGRRPVYLCGALGFAILVYPMFWAINSRSTALMIFAFLAAFALISVAMSGPLAALLSELFSTEIRSTGVSMAYQGATIAAGFTPLLASSLLVAAGGGKNTGLVGAFVVVIALLAAVTVGSGKESRGADLRTTGFSPRQATADDVEQRSVEA